MIKRILYIILPLMFLSCEKIFINGDLDGMWKLKLVEMDGKEYYPHNITYSFQRHMALLGEYYEEGIPTYYKAEFTYNGDIITMGHFYEYPGQEGVCNMDDLKKYFIFDETVVFTVDRLDDEKLVMHTDYGVYYFEKW
ncbi:MAG: lipocalin-like domain-containing protein [Bacteroidaceae bacterium]|nr:lipocalin-like domain-containing protein [Bacteroidaceae bacterium]